MPGVALIPTEIWQDILSEACTDGGFTGRSLSLTSRFFYSQSLSSRYRSLVFESLQRLEGFLKALRNHTDGYRPIIEHLYISFYDEPIKTPRGFYVTYNRMSEEQRQKKDESVRAEKAHWNARFCAAWSDLFSVAGPSLRTLCVVEDGVAPLTVEFPCDLPRLEELTWMGRFTGFDGVARPTLFPALRRVHCLSLSGDPLPWVVTCTSLTHLRISSVGARNGHLHKELAAAVGVPDAVWLYHYHDEDEDDAVRARREVPPPPTHPRLRHIVIHGIAPAPGPGNGYFGMHWRHVHHEVKRLARYCEEHLDGVQVVVMEGAREKEGQWRERLRQEWLDRMRGGRGCWVEAEEEEEEDSIEVFYTAVVDPSLF
ncbi:hypothetical protein C8Q79DRAFT_1006673 [Trametes meyenii]|nr:hypothetical protein C8Q79DRAFT_1006673 [Trametes meyenii]